VEEVFMGWVTPVPSVRRIEQTTASTCWLASCKMLFQWKNKPIGDVDTLLQNSSDSRVDYDTWCQFGVDHGDLVPLAKCLGFGWGAGGKISAWSLADTMKKCGPIVAVGTWNTYSHVLVIAEVEDVVDKDDNYGSSARIRVANPWFGCDEREERNLFWLNSGLGHWEGVNGQYMHW
jgi:hypothetical protein